MPKNVQSAPASAVPHGSLRQLREQAAHCTACPLYKNATQMVFGEGLQKAKVVFVGEQPGHEEDLAGRPFVGPAGKLLERALADAGVDRREVYVTNAVKHFKWTPRGKRRLHQKPDAREIMACQPWLLAELAAIRPRLVICLGATAVRSVLGTGARVLRDRGKPLTSPHAPYVFVTVHPSAVLRAPDDAAREEGYRNLVADLKAAIKAAGPFD